METGHKRQLDELLGEANVLTSQPDRLAYNNDCWPRGIIRSRGLDLDHHLPEAIVRPDSREQLRKLVEWARETRIPLVPFGAGSGVCGGALTDGNGVIVDLKSFDDIRAIDSENLLVDVEPGLIGYPFERKLRSKGFTLGHFPSSIYCSSVGGWLAARSAGQFSSRYGKIEDMVDSLEVVTGTGRLREVGPDESQLFVGSEGTLGFITSAKLHLKPEPKQQFYRGFRFDDLSEVLDSLRDLMQSGLRPCLLRLYDATDSLLQSHDDNQTDANLVERLQSKLDQLLPSHIKDGVDDSVQRIGRNMVGRLAGRPFIVNSLSKKVSRGFLMLVGFEGSGPAVDIEANCAFDILSHSGKDLGSEPGRHWLENRYSVSYKQSPLYETGAFVDTMEISAPWSKLEDLYYGVRDALEEHVVSMAHFSHAYPEGCSIYFTFCGYGSTTKKTLDVYDAAWSDGLDAAHACDGSVAHHHGVGKHKAPWTHLDHRGGLEQFRRLKDNYDPDRILNPGTVYSNR
jgi:alkyldihydroxyacetonephosphate synthase